MEWQRNRSPLKKTKGFVFYVTNLVTEIQMVQQGMYCRDGNGRNRVELRV